MDCCSPKDGYVIDVPVRSGAQVQENQLVIQMDSDFEDRAEARIDTMDATRRLTAAQYLDPTQVATIRAIAQSAVDKTATYLESARKAADIAQKQLDLGQLPNALAYLNAAAQAARAGIDYDKAVNQLAQFNMAVERHVKINAEAEKHSALERSFIAKRRDRLRIVAPKSGVITLSVLKGSFAELGSVLFTIR